VSTEQNPSAAPAAEQPAPAFMRVTRITGGTIHEGPWHDMEPAPWRIGAAHATCGVRGRQDHYDTATELQPGARRCPRCSAIRREREDAT
jgi:hypothetical protein